MMHKRDKQDDTAAPQKRARLSNSKEEDEIENTPVSETRTLTSANTKETMKPQRERETDVHKLEKRQKQVDFGKNTS
jgi:hypothetical protein